MGKVEWRKLFHLGKGHLHVPSRRAEKLRMEALSQELEELFRGTESQFYSRINLFYPSYEPVLGLLRFRCESNYEGAAHFGYQK